MFFAAIPRNSGRIPLASALAAVLLPAVAAAGTLAVHPFEGPATVSPAAREELLQVVVRAIRSPAARAAHLAPASPVVPRSVCPSPVSTGCLARLALESGPVVSGTVRSNPPYFELSLLLTDASGTSGPERVVLNTLLEDERPVIVALTRLVRRRESDAAERRTPPAGWTDAAPRAPGATAPGAPGLPAAAVAPPLGAARPDEGLPRGAWITAAGAALLLVGGAVGLFDRLEADDLTARFNAGTLTTADGARYARIDTLNVVANALFVLGGATATTGLCFWTTIDAPSDGHPRPPSMGIRGRF